MKARRIGTGEVRAAAAALLYGAGSTSERTAAIEAALRGRGARQLRGMLARLVVELIPVETLVPDVHRQWRPIVREAMTFVVTRLSAARLAPKIVEQLELPAETPPEARLLRLIAVVPGLQKIGQVLARNRELDPALRRALTELENGISDVRIEQIREIITQQLGPQMEAYQVKVAPSIYFEASVSAVVGFTWKNPESRRRERGVFKVLKPHIAACFAEDMKILEQLPRFLARKHQGGRTAVAGVAETFTEIRLLLEHEVEFLREQNTLLKDLGLYRAIPGIRVPRLIERLSTATITALTHERGIKVTEVFQRRGPARVRVAERLAEALLAAPALAPEGKTTFHADPHAGNVLYDRQRGELVILDWALTDRLTREQRKHVLILVLMTILRDREGVAKAIEHLSPGTGKDPKRAILIRTRTESRLASLPLFRLPGTLDAMHLLHELALEGVRFPASLLMFRKATFTLDGVLEDVAGAPVQIDAVILRRALADWRKTGSILWSLLSPADWVALQWSAVTLPSRLCWHAVYSVVSSPWRWLSAPAVATGAGPAAAVPAA